MKTSNPLVADGNIEIWHHGYYHDKANRVEFSGGTYDEQYKQLKDTIDLMQDKCGITLRTFGPPYNATDKVTIEALNNLPQMKVFFFPSVTEGGTQLMLRESGNLETDTGVVDYDKFVETYESSKKDKPYLVLQGHPGNFSDQSFENFKKIVEYLMAKNTVFMTPTEYYNKLNGVSSVFPENGKYNQADNPGDYSVALTLNGNTLASVSNGGKELIKDTDYTLAGDTVVLKSDYLMALEPAAYDFTFRFSAKDDAKLSLKVIDPSKEPIRLLSTTSRLLLTWSQLRLTTVQWFPSAQFLKNSAQRLHGTVKRTQRAVSSTRRRSACRLIPQQPMLTASR